MVKVTLLPSARVKHILQHTFQYSATRGQAMSRREIDFGNGMQRVAHDKLNRARKNNHFIY